MERPASEILRILRISMTEMYTHTQRTREHSDTSFHMGALHHVITDEADIQSRRFSATGLLWQLSRQRSLGRRAFERVITETE